jgi:hypothetical protein
MTNGEVRTYCGKCGYEINTADIVCPKCKGDLTIGGKKYTVAISASAGITGTLSTVLTKQEQITLKKIRDFLLKRVKDFELSEIELGFPSGVKVKFNKLKENK